MGDKNHLFRTGMGELAMISANTGYGSFPQILANQAKPWQVAVHCRVSNLPGQMAILCILLFSLFSLPQLGICRACPVASPASKRTHSKGSSSLQASFVRASQRQNPSLQLRKDGMEVLRPNCTANSHETPKGRSPNRLRPIMVALAPEAICNLSWISPKFMHSIWSDLPSSSSSSSPSSCSSSYYYSSPFVSSSPPCCCSSSL